MTPYLSYLWKTLTSMSRKVLRYLGKEIKPKDAGLLWCTKEGSLMMARKMLQRGANINCYNEDMLSPLHIAVERYDTRMVKLFLQQPNINVNIRDSQWNTPLHVAVEFRHLGLVPLLITKGADVNAKNTLQRTPLHTAAIQCLLETSQILIDNGAEVDVEDAFGKTPIRIATLKYGCPEMTSLLLRNGASISLLTKNALSLLSEAILHARSESDIDAIKTMLRNGADINEPEPIGLRTPLHFAAMTQKLNVVKLLLDYGADPTALNSAKQMPYKTALLFKNKEVADILEFQAKQKTAFMEQKRALGFRE